MARPRLDNAFKVAAWYFAAATVYLVGSGWLLFRGASSEPRSFLDYEIVNGLAFATVTSALLYALVRHHFRRMQREADRQAEIEQALRHSRDQLATAHHIARLGTWEANLATRKLYWSDEMYAIYGLAKEAFGHTIEAGLACLHPEDRKSLIRAHDQILASGGRLEREYRIVRPDGEVRYVLERAEVNPPETGRPVLAIGTVQDVTERKQAELELEKRNRQQAAIAEIGMEALRTGDVRRSMEHAMEAASRILEVEYAGVLEHLPEQGVLRLVTDLGRPADVIDATVPSGNLSQAGYTLSINAPVVVEDLRTETRFKGAQVLLEGGVVSGMTTVIHGDRAPWGVLGVYSSQRRTFSQSDVTFLQALANLIGDVLQRDKALAVIREQSILRQMASEAANLGGWAYDLETRAVTWSEEVARMHEVPADYVPDVETALAFYAPEYRDRITRALEACSRDGTPYDEELELITARGRRLWVRVIGEAERDSDGRVVRVHGAIQDVSERRTLESMLHRSQRLEAVGQLTGGIAHDFNNLLTVILGNADQILEGVSGDDRLRALAETTLQAAHRGAELTNRLLAYARKQPLQPKPTDVGALLTGMDHLLRRSLGEQIEIELVRGGGLWTAMVDPAQLEAAVMNLCLNARDAMPDGGHLTLETANVHLDDDYARQEEELAPGQYVMIAVTDTGHGIPADVAEHVFEPFFTTKDSGQGSGLGLSMVYGFAKQSRGHVKLYSEPGEGTTVKLYLPRTWEAAASTDRPAQRGLPRGGGQRVLVVEDDELVRHFVASQVQSLGYEVLTAANAAQALELLHQRTDLDLLFTDVVMPGAMDGRHLADAARALYPDLPVLFTSGYTENAIVHQGRLDPGIALLTKPYRLIDLAEKLHSVLHPDQET